jgi:prophage regulatory protein
MNRTETTSPPVTSDLNPATVHARTSYRIIRIGAVKDKLGISRSSIYQRISQGSFPKQVRLGPHSVGWVENEVEAWLADRISESRPVAEGVAQ